MDLKKGKYNLYSDKNELSLCRNESILDKDIKNYIKERTKEEYEKIIAEDGRWLVFYHLSKIRESILNWYEFSEEASLLEIGAGYGALTGMFCVKCNNVTAVEYYKDKAETIKERYKDMKNLNVYAGSIEDFNSEKKFDYITMIGNLEYQGEGSSDLKIYEKYLKKVKSLLKPNGKLIIATENRLGLRYFCGGEAPFTQKPFDGINNYPHGSKGYAFSRQELKDIIRMAGFKKVKFYYPLPDYKITQVVYSEDYLPKGRVKERVQPYYLNKHSLVAYENDLYDDIVANGMFEFMSNSFLIECADVESLCNVVSATISSDRKQGERYITAIYKDNYVVKKSIDSNSMGIKVLEKNLNYLRNRGILVIQSKLNHEELTMPYIEAKTLSEYLGSVVTENKFIFLDLIDQLYKNILNSSEHVGEEYNKLQVKGINEEEWGIILKKCFVDMIPINCFYEEEKIVFFDQEFVKENYPAKYVLFRALFYLYLLFPQVEEVVPLSQLKEKYCFTEAIWKRCQQEEQIFVADNRNYQMHRHFLDWSYIDRNKIYDNGNKLKKGE